ncbi:MAG: trimethylamine methyltransferase family protein [Haloarculaceae archaeon]
MDDRPATVSPPQMDRLSSAGERAVHDAALAILADGGVRVDHDDARAILAEGGCTVDAETHLVTFPPDLVADALDAAPSSFTVRGRGRQPDVTVGDGEPIRSPTAGLPYVVRHGDDRRFARMADYETFLKLAQMENVLDAANGVVVPRDVDGPAAGLETQKRDLLLTDKLPGGGVGEAGARACAEMVGIVHDDPDLSEYYLVGGASSISPRVWNETQTGSLLEHARMEQPVVIGSPMIAGVLGPAPLAGAMALADAEVLAGIVLAQLVTRGTPVVYGMSCSNADMRYGTFTIGSPASALWTAVTGQMARYYGLPSRAGGCLTDAKTVDDQSGWESSFHRTVTALSGIDYVFNAAGVLDSFATGSPEKVVLDCERIRAVQRFGDAFALDDDAFALDAIAETEPGERFLTRPETADRAAAEFFAPDLASRGTVDDWREDGNRTAFERAHDRVETLLDDYERPPVDADVERDLERYVAEKRVAADG